MDTTAPVIRTVSHQETPCRSLLGGVLAVAVAWLLVGTVVASAEAPAAPTPALENLAAD